MVISKEYMFLQAFLKQSDFKSPERFTTHEFFQAARNQRQISKGLSDTSSDWTPPVVKNTLIALFSNQSRDTLAPQGKEHLNSKASHIHEGKAPNLTTSIRDKRVGRDKQ